MLFLNQQITKVPLLLSCVGLNNVEIKKGSQVSVKFRNCDVHHLALQLCNCTDMCRAGSLQRLQGGSDCYCLTEKVGGGQKAGMNLQGRVISMYSHPNTGSALLVMS